MGYEMRAVEHESDWHKPGVGVAIREQLYALDIVEQTDRAPLSEAEARRASRGSSEALLTGSRGGELRRSEATARPNCHRLSSAQAGQSWTMP